MLELSLLTIALVCVTFITGFIRLFKHPPEIRVNLTLDKLVVQHQVIPSKEETEAQSPEPIPEDILTYIDGESDEWARDARKRRVRLLKRESGSWDAAFRLLQREDALPE